MEEAADFLFSDDILTNPTQSTLRSFLSLFNIRVDEFNTLMMNRISGAEVERQTFDSCLAIQCWPSLLATYLSYDRAKEVENPTKEPPSTVQSDYLALINEPGIPPHTLHLKVGAICSILRNLSIEKGLLKNDEITIIVVIYAQHRIDWIAWNAW
jgi:hypothetical protein